MFKIPRVLNRNLVLSRRLSTVLKPQNVEGSTQQQNDVNEYSEVPEYPQILSSDFRAARDRRRLQWHQKIKQISTIEEKLIEINMPRYYGHNCLLLNEKDFPYNTLPFFQYATNTEFVEQSHAPKGEEEVKRIDNFLNLIKSDIQDAFEFELDAFKKSFDIKAAEVSKSDVARMKTSGMVKQVNRILINTLGGDNRHLYEADADIDPRHEAFWFVGQIEPTERVKGLRKSRKWMEGLGLVNDPLNRPFQYSGSPFLALRHQHPLAPFEDIDFDAVISENKNIPKVTMDPRTLGFFTDHRHGTTTPGFWPGNVREYGLVSFHDRHFINARNRSVNFGQEDKQDALHSQGIVTSYAWLLAQACFQGFSTYNDMTYPLATQTVITDGQFWSFYKYQLNTTCMHTNIDAPNHRYNKCWGSSEMKLFDEIDGNGKLQGLNDDVLKNLIMFYVNQPKQRQHEMKPFLGKDKKIADLEDVKIRGWLEKTFKHIMSNRPRHRLTPEIYNWEKIYKIDNKTLPLARKLRFFELRINPWQRRLNEHQPKYIPRDFRARGIHDKKKFEATYYPLDHRSNIPKELSHSMIGAPRDPFACRMDRKRKSYR